MRALSKSLLAVLLATVTVPLSANEIDDLVNASQSIRDTFAYGIKTIAGGESYAGEGYISPAMADSALISKAQQDAYNAAVAAVQSATYSYDPGADQYFQDQADQAMDEVSEMIDAYVEAAQQIIMVATVNEMAQDAQQAPDEREAMALQEFMGANDVTLQDEEIDAYNDALSNTEQAIQVAAAYMAVANDENLLEQANDMAFDMRVTYEEAASIFFDLDTEAVWVSFDGGNTIQGLQVGNYFVAAQDVLTRAETQEFWTTSPEGGCWFAENQEGVCTVALEDLEVNVGGTSIKGVWIAIVLTFGSTIGGSIWAASQFFAQLNEQSEAVIAATAQAEALATRFDDLREMNAQRLQAMDVKLSNMEQAMTAADVENLQGKLSELGANLMQIMDAQKELLDIRDRIASVEKTSSESEIKVQTRLESLATLDARLKNLSVIWMIYGWLSMPPIHSEVIDGRCG